MVSNTVNTLKNVTNKCLSTQYSEENYNTHMGIRIFKNHCFRYEGTIHEQLIPINKKISLKPHLTD